MSAGMMMMMTTLAVVIMGTLVWMFMASILRNMLKTIVFAVCVYLLVSTWTASPDQDQIDMIEDFTRIYSHASSMGFHMTRSVKLIILNVFRFFTKTYTTIDVVIPEWLKAQAKASTVEADIPPQPQPPPHRQ
jgi:type III secretory pathway component EscU